MNDFGQFEIIKDMGSHKGRSASKKHSVTFGGMIFGDLEVESMLSDKTRKRIRALERLRKHLGRVKYAAWLTASQKKHHQSRMLNRSEWGGGDK